MTNLVCSILLYYSGGVKDETRRCIVSARVKWLVGVRLGVRSRLTKLCGGYIFRQQALLRAVNLHKVIGCREAHSYACRFRQTSLAPTWLTSSLRLGARFARPRKTHLLTTHSERQLCDTPTCYTRRLKHTSNDQR